MIEYAYDNLLAADVKALVNPVNCVGVMGKGLALQFKHAFPENFHQYQTAAHQKKILIGKMFVVQEKSSMQYIINFPTKTHWRTRSNIHDINAGLHDLVQIITNYAIESIALPALGCGNGGLDWHEVEPLIVQHLKPLQQVDILIYPPQKKH